MPSNVWVTKNLQQVEVFALPGETDMDPKSKENVPLYLMILRNGEKNTSRLEEKGSGSPMQGTLAP